MSIATEAQQELAACARYAARWFGLDAESIHRALEGCDFGSPTALASSIERLGLGVQVLRGHSSLAHSGVPAILYRKKGGAWIYDPLHGSAGNILKLAEGGDAAPETASTAEIKKELLPWALLVFPSPANAEAFAPRGGGQPAPGRYDWLWSSVWEHRGDSFSIIASTLLIHVMALAMPLFVRAVYDRVIPNNAIETLWVLTIGVTLAISFDFVIRILRGWFVDAAGKRLDHALGERIYHHALSIDLGARPPSAGSFAGNLRGYESVREFLSAASMLAIVDIPMSLLLIGLIFWLAGPVGWLPVLGCAIVIGFTLLLQPSLRRLMQQSYQGALARQALTVETANGLESVKAANAEPALERRMREIVVSSENVDLRTRRLTQIGMSVTAFVVSAVNIAVIVISVYLIARHELTMGGLIACTMVIGRAMTPLTGLANLLLRVQQTSAALHALDHVMRLPRENARAVLRKEIRFPSLRLARASFTYPRQKTPSLRGIDLTIRQGERVAILGRAGAGKSTLLRLLSRLHVATEGMVLLDEVEIGQWPGSAVRRSIAYLPQDGALFHGTIRENVLIADPRGGDAALLEAARISCLTSWVNLHPEGFDRPVGERGVLLSGGQRQMVMLARCLVQNPDVLLLDEPTHGFDSTTDRLVTENLTEYLAAEPRRTLVLATHKSSLLRLVDRIILLEDGRILADGPRDAIVRAMRKQGGDGEAPGDRAVGLPAELQPAQL